MQLLNYSYNKNKTTQIGLARMFIIWELDQRIPTYEKLEDYFGVARGTIQNAIKLLSDSDAVKLESRGSLGTYLIAKDIKKLVAQADIEYILGSLPIPNYRLAEGMSTALLSCMDNDYGIDVKITFVRSVKERVDLLANRRFDFSIVSKKTAVNLIKRGDDVEIAADFGPGTLYSGFRLIYANQQAQARGFWPQMRVGITSYQMEQYRRSRDIFDQYNPIYVDVPYDQLNRVITDGRADVILRAIDLIEDNIKQLPYIDLKQMDETGSAVMIVNSQRKDLIYLVRQLIDVEQVKAIQNGVVNEEIIATY